MAENKNTFIFYCDWKKTFDELPDEDAGKLIKHLLSYVTDESPNTDNLLVRATFASMKTTLKRDLKKWENIRKVRSEAGKQGGRPQKNKDLKAKKANAFPRKQSKAKKAVFVNVNVNDNVINKNTLCDFEKFWSLYDLKQSKNDCIHTGLEAGN